MNSDRRIGAAYVVNSGDVLLADRFERYGPCPRVLTVVRTIIPKMQAFLLMVWSETKKVFPFLSINSDHVDAAVDSLEGNGAVC